MVTEAGRAQISFYSLGFSHSGQLRSHEEQPVDGLLQEPHLVMGRDIPEHSDLLGEALDREEAEESMRHPDLQEILVITQL